MFPAMSRLCVLTGSNRQPTDCKSGAYPLCYRPSLRWAVEGANFRPQQCDAVAYRDAQNSRSAAYPA